MTKYLIAEKFRSVQGEGVYAGTPMAFIRFVGCSVGKTCCVACDTDFEQPVPWRGGGEFTLEELAEWWFPYTHICLTGGEPFDQDLLPFFEATGRSTRSLMLHIESSGTKLPPAVLRMGHDLYRTRTWLCVSPKPGWSEEMINLANEVKVIMPGLGILKNGVCQPYTKKRGVPQVLDRISIDASSSLPTLIKESEELELRWPTLEDALRWARAGKTVFIQPRNHKLEVDKGNLKICQDIVAEHPELRLSLQLHKVLGVQ